MVGLRCEDKEFVSVHERCGCILGIQVFLSLEYVVSNMVVEDCLIEIAFCFTLASEQLLLDIARDLLVVTESVERCPLILLLLIFLVIKLVEHEVVGDNALRG